MTENEVNGVIGCIHELWYSPLKLEKKFFEESLVDARNEIVEIKPKIKARDVQLKDRDQEISKLKVEIDQLNDCIKSLEQENERLRSCVPTWIKCHYCDHECHNEVAADIYHKLKEREEMVKELILFDDCDEHCSNGGHSKGCKKRSELVKKARKLIGEKE